MKATGKRDARAKAAFLTVAAILLGGLAVMLAPSEHAAPSSAPAPQPGPHAAEIDLGFRRGVIMLHAKQYDHAVTAFHQVIKYAPDMPETHVNMGFALVGLGRFAAARDFFESATALRPGQVNAYYGLAVALEGLGDLPGALGAMRTFLHLADPQDPFRRKAEAAVWEWEEARQAK